MDDNKSGCGCGGLLTALALVMFLAGVRVFAVPDLPWWAILAPLWMPMVLVTASLAIMAVLVGAVLLVVAVAESFKRVT